MIGVVVPVHDEQACLGACLEALRLAATCPLLHGGAVCIVIVLEHAMQADLRWRLDCLAIQAQNVGSAVPAGWPLRTPIRACRPPG